MLGSKALGGNLMPPSVLAFLVSALLFTSSISRGQSQTLTNSTAPFRVAIAGMAHGHTSGFLHRVKDRHDVEIVGVAEADRKLFDRYAADFHLSTNLYHTDLDDMLDATHPQAVLVYTNTFDHRRAVEICAKHRMPVMMEKPLAVSNEDARAIAKAAHDANIPVLVNYETTWYRSNRAAYDLVHQSAI